MHGFPLLQQHHLHALHYHQINIFEEQKKIINREQAKLDDLLTIPIADRPNWSVDEINSEISNSAQTLLGYVVRWIDQGSWLFKSS